MSNIETNQIETNKCIAELQIEPNQNHLLKNLEGSIFAWLLLLFVTLTTVLMLLWPLKMLTGDGL